MKSIKKSSNTKQASIKLIRFRICSSAYLIKIFAICKTIQKNSIKLNGGDKKKQGKKESLQTRI